MTKSEKLRAIRRPKTSPPLSPLAKNRESAGLLFSLLASSPFLSETSLERTREGVHSRLLSRASLAWLLPAPRNWELASRLALVLPMLQHQVREKSYSGPGNRLKFKARVRMGPLQNTQEITSFEKLISFLVFYKHSVIGFHYHKNSYIDNLKRKYKWE